MGNRYKLSEAAAAVEPQILEALQHGPMSLEELAEVIDLPEGKDRIFLKNQLTRLRMRGAIKYSMATGWSLDDGAPSAARQRAAAGTVASSVAQRRDTTTDAPSRHAPPPKRTTPAVASPPLGPRPRPSSRKPDLAPTDERTTEEQARALGEKIRSIRKDHVENAVQQAAKDIREDARAKNVPDNDEVPETPPELRDGHQEEPAAAPPALVDLEVPRFLDGFTGYVTPPRLTAEQRRDLRARFTVRAADLYAQAAELIRDEEA